MITMRISEAARLLGGKHHGPDGVFRGCGIDTRALSAGALFVALPGARVDGHDFVGLAAAKGAAVAMVECHARDDDYGSLPIIEVPDCRHALGELAGIWRARFTRPLVAITGSNGKTTVKELLAAIFRNQGPTHATQGNLNNELGVPLTLLGLDEKHQRAVVEMGANHPGEIAGLARMARPTVGVITRCAPAHLEGFGSIEGVARAKGELLESLDPAGIAVINADDPYADLWREMAGARRVMAFGLDKPADVSARVSTHVSTNYGWTEDGMALTLKTPIGRQRVQMKLPGRHNVLNALAATAAAIAVECSLETIAAGLTSVEGIDGRLQIKQASNGARIIDDTYNANPDSLSAALTVLASYPGPRWLVLGDMAELGEQGPELHEQAGVLAREQGVTRLFATGALCKYAVNAFGAGGEHCADAEELSRKLRGELAEGAGARGITRGITILVKGSRSMRMERIIEGLLT